ncbi:TPA: hypothetical protein ACGEYK_002923 [Raoultella ornithinolytica]
MNLKKRLATVLWLGLALAASTMAAPPSPAQGHVGGGVTSLVTGVAQEDGDVSAAQAIRDAELQCGSAGAAHWALYQRLRDRSAPASPPRPDFSGHWLLNTKASDDPREKAKEAAQASRQAWGGGRGMGGGPGGMGRGGGMSDGRQGRGGGMGGSGGLSSGELSALLAPAQELHVTHQDPMLLIADESDRRQRLFTDFRGASVSANGGLQQRVAVAGWEGAVLVVETTTLGKKFVQSYQIDGGNGQLVISSVAQVSEGRPVSYRLVYDRLNPDLGEKQARRNVSAGQGGTR